jgi:hypothetical protein
MKKRPVHEYIEKARVAKTKDELLKILANAARLQMLVSEDWLIFDEDKDATEEDYQEVYDIVSERLVDVRRETVVAENRFPNQPIRGADEFGES